jgi:hypothetical protein
MPYRGCGARVQAAIDLRIRRAWSEAATKHCGEHAILRPQRLQRSAKALSTHVETHNLLLLLLRPSPALRIATAARHAD